MIETGKFCKQCNRSVMARRREANHVLWLVLFVFGLVVPMQVFSRDIPQYLNGVIAVCAGGFWFLDIMSTLGNWRCSQCGNKC